MPASPHVLKVGEIDITVFDDGQFQLPKEYFFNLPDDFAEALTTPVVIGANLWFIRTGERGVLVDTGSGEALRQMFPDTGQAHEATLGQNVTDVVLTHMHADHLGGLMGGAFPKAKIHVAGAEWAFWTQEGLAEAVPEDQRPMIEMVQAVATSFADRVVVHEGSADLGGGLRLDPLPGHTPGHSGLVVESGGEILRIIGDAVISKDVHFAQPGAGYALDGDAEAAAATRKALLADLAESGALIAATHLPFPGLGRVKRDGDAYRFEPV